LGIKLISNPRSKFLEKHRESSGERSREVRFSKTTSWLLKVRPYVCPKQLTLTRTTIAILLISLRIRGIKINIFSGWKRFNILMAKAYETEQ
jgi:hypothetical protein